MIASFKKVIKTGWLNFVRNSGISIATCFIIGMTLFLMTSLLVMKDITNYLINLVQEKVDISIYFREDAAEQEILNLKDQIVKIPEVKDVVYVSKAEALDKFVERYKDDSVVMESLAEVGNPLRPSLNVKAWQANQYEAVITFIDGSSSKDLIEKVDYYERKPVIDRIFKTTTMMNALGITMSLILAMVAVLVSFNQVRLAIYNSREEIGIQRLVGASNWFIRGPFLAEGAMSGIFASVATTIVFSIILLILSPRFDVILSGFSISGVFFAKFWPLFFIQMLIGVGLGVFSSIIAIRKYLEV